MGEGGGGPSPTVDQNCFKHQPGASCRGAFQEDNCFMGEKMQDNFCICIYWSVCVNHVAS